MLELEKRKIERDKRSQAEKAMEALEVTKAGAQGEPSKEDVAFIVSGDTPPSAVRPGRAHVHVHPRKRRLTGR